MYSCNDDHKRYKYIGEKEKDTKEKSNSSLPVSVIIFIVYNILQDINRTKKNIDSFIHYEKPIYLSFELSNKCGIPNSQDAEDWNHEEDICNNADKQ